MSQNEVRSRRAGQRRKTPKSESRRVGRVPAKRVSTSYHHHLLAVHIRRIVRIKHIPIICERRILLDSDGKHDSRKFSSSR